MNTTWIDIIEMMEGSLQTGNLASRTLLTFANEINLPNIFHTLCTKSLYHRNWATRVNAASALHSLAEKFSQFIKRLIMTTSSDGELFSLQSIDINSIISNGRQLYSDDDLPRNPNKLYGKDWLQYQRKALKKLLGMNIDLAEIKLCNDYDSLDYLINVGDVEYKINQTEGINNRITSLSNTQKNCDESAEVWIVRLLRFMISGLLDSKWETRHGCSLGLKGILSGLCPSFCDFESEGSKKESTNKNDSFELFHSKSPNEGQKPFNIPLNPSEVPCSSDADNISISNDPIVLEAVSWLPVFLVEDIISSGLCVMVLDRFVDFTVTSASVAPVRESCAQLVAFSSSIYSAHFFQRTLLKLIDMCSYEGHWTVNYGGLTALKYVIPIYFATTAKNNVRFRNSSISSAQPSIAQNNNNNNNSNHLTDGDYLNTIIDVIIRLLKESIVDDVICAAAKVVISIRYISVIKDVKHPYQNNNSRGVIKINYDKMILLRKLPAVLLALIDCLNKADDASTFLPYVAYATNSCYHVIANIITMIPLNEDATSASNTPAAPDMADISTTTSSEGEGLPQDMAAAEAGADDLNILDHISQICGTYSGIVKTLLRLRVTGTALLQCLEVMVSTMSGMTQQLTQLTVTASRCSDSDSNSKHLWNSLLLLDDSVSIKLTDSVLVLACDIFLIFDSSLLSVSQLSPETTADATSSSSCLLTKEEFKAGPALSNKAPAPRPAPPQLMHSPSLTNKMHSNKEWRKLNDICNQLSITTVKLTSCAIFLFKLCQEAKAYASNDSSVHLPLLVDKELPELSVCLLLVGSLFMTYKTELLCSDCISTNIVKPAEDAGERKSLIWNHLLSEYLSSNADVTTTNSNTFVRNDTDRSNGVMRNLYETVLHTVFGSLSGSEKEPKTIKETDGSGGWGSLKDGEGKWVYCIGYLVEWIRGGSYLLELISLQSNQYKDGDNEQSFHEASAIPDTGTGDQDQFTKYQRSLWELLVLPLLNKLTVIEDKIKATPAATSIKKIRKPLFTMTIGTQTVSKYSDSSSPSDNIDRTSQYFKISEYFSNTLLAIVQACCGMSSALPAFYATTSVDTPSLTTSIPMSGTPRGVTMITNIIGYFKDEKRIPHKYDNILDVMTSLVNNDLTALMELAVGTCCQLLVSPSPPSSLSQVVLSLSSSSTGNTSISTSSLHRPISTKLELYERLIIDIMIDRFKRYLSSVEPKEVPVPRPPWAVVVPPFMMTMLSGEKNEAASQLACDIIYGVAKQLDLHFFDNLFPLKYLCDTDDEDSSLEQQLAAAWCAAIPPSALSNLLSSALPALTPAAKLAVNKSIRLLGESFFVSFVKFVCKNHDDVNGSFDHDIFVSKIADVLVAIVDADESFPCSTSIGGTGNIVNDVPLTSFASLRALACTLGTLIITSPQYLNSPGDRCNIRGRLAASLLGKLAVRFGAALVRPKEGEASAYSYWLTAALAGISHGEALVRRLSSETLRTLVPYASLTTGQLHHDDDDGSLEYPGMSRASRIMERMLTTGSPSLLGSDPLDIPLLIRFRALTGFSLPPGITLAGSSGATAFDISRAARDDDLRGYQWEGVSWMTSLRRCGLGFLLADDMGLGKTLQTLAALALLQLERESQGGLGTRCLVICPAVLVLHWESEAVKFFPLSLLRVVTHTNERIAGTKGSHNSSNGSIVVTSESMSAEDSSYGFMEEKSVVGERGCVVTVASYAALRTRSPALLGPHWDAVVVDESHSCRNPHSQLSLALSEVRSSTRIALSGTPVQNQVQELWSIMRFLIPDYLGSYSDFRKNYVIPIEKAYRQKEKENRQQQQQSMEGVSRFRALGIAAEGVDKLQSLHKQVLPFILRRKKEDVLQELPSKTVVDVLCPLSPEQQELYSTMQKGLKLSDTQLEELLLRKREGIERKGSITKEKLHPVHPLKALLYLSLLSVHPAIVISEAHGSYRSKLLNDGKCSGKMVGLAKVLYESNIVQREECEARLWEDLYLDDEGSVLETSTEDMEAQRDDLSEEEEEEEVCQPPKKKSKKQLVDKKKTPQVKPAKKRPKKGSKADLKDSSNKNAVEERLQPQPPDYNEAAVNSIPPTAAGMSPPPAEIGHKCLIFAKHRSALDTIESCVLQRYFPTVPYARLDGSVPPRERASIARSFNDCDSSRSNTSTSTSTTSKSSNSRHTHSDVRVLLLSTSSCGLGLSLTAADTVVFVEHSWNPFDDLQASDRVHRLGQTRPVTIYRLLAECTVEERVLGVQGRKLNVVSELINEDNSQLMDLITTTDYASKKTLGSTLFSSLVAKDSNKPIEALTGENEDFLLEYESLNVESFLTSLGLD